MEPASQFASLPASPAVGSAPPPASLAQPAAAQVRAGVIMWDLQVGRQVGMGQRRGEGGLEAVNTYLP